MRSMEFGICDEQRPGGKYYFANLINLQCSYILHVQEMPFCGPEKEVCVKSQPLEDKSCLVPCNGLYADIADVSGMQSVIKGTMF